MCRKLVLSTLLSSIAFVAFSADAPDTLAKRRYPGVGRIIEVDFDGNAYELRFAWDGRTMTFTGVRGKDIGNTETVEYKAVATAYGQYMVYWQEPIFRANVVHVQNWLTHEVYTNISEENLVFNNWAGTFILKGWL